MSCPDCHLVFLCKYEANIRCSELLSGCKYLSCISCICLHTHMIRSWKVPWTFPYTYYYLFLHSVIIITVWFSFSSYYIEIELAFLMWWLVFFFSFLFLMFSFFQVNVEGVHCDRCKSGTFGLSARNPLGCSSCYCFGLTTQCSEARGLVRTWVSRKLLSHVMR